jgi:hypothetical protein
MNQNYFYFYLQTPKMGANDASGGGLQYALNNMHQNKFRESYDELTSFLFFNQSYRQILEIVCTSSKFNTFHAKRR